MSAPPFTAASAVARVDLTNRSLGESLAEIADIGAQTIRGAAGSGIVALDYRGVAKVAATSSWVHDLDAGQLTRQEGPVTSTLAHGHSHPHVSLDLAADDRWPALAVPAAKLPARAVIAVPLLRRQRIIGALTVYAEPGGFCATSVQQARLTAQACAVVVGNALALAAASERAHNLKAAMAGRSVIEQAKGLLIARDGCTAEVAFETLRDMSQHEHLKLSAVAERLICEAQRVLQ